METGLVKTPTFERPAGLPEKGGKRAEYLLVIYPGGELQEKLMKEQDQFAADYGLQIGLHNKPRVVMNRPFVVMNRPFVVMNRPFVTLAAFQAGEVMEEMLIRWIQRISNCYTSFDLTFNNYSGFPPHTIYLRVQDPWPFRMLMQQLRAIDEFIRSSGCPPAHLFNRPFLTIAGGLTEQVYNKALPDFSRRTFHDTFHVGELVLLKRTHAFDACRTVNIFRLRQPEAEPLSRWPLPHI